MNKELLKYVENGIDIDGNPIDGYTVFTVVTQHFKISSLDELTPERFEKAIVWQEELRLLENKMFDALNNK